MPSSTLLPIIAFVLFAGSVGGVLVAVFYPQIAGGSPFDRRLQAISTSRGAVARSSEAGGERARKRTVKETLEEADELHKAKTLTRYKPSLTTRLRQADIAWTRGRYFLTCIGVGAAVFVALLGTVGVLPAIGF